jgi:hypothetical protein
MYSYKRLATTGGKEGGTSSNEKQNLFAKNGIAWSNVHINFSNIRFPSK